MSDLERGPVTVRIYSEGNEYGHEPFVKATLTMIWWEMLQKRGEIDMRNTFDIELKVDVRSSDEKRLQTFIELIASTARLLYGQAAMIAARPPELKVTVEGLNGITNINIFEGEQFKADEDA